VPKGLLDPLGLVEGKAGNGRPYRSLVKAGLLSFVYAGDSSTVRCLVANQDLVGSIPIARSDAFVLGDLLMSAS
jgi:hypothetical protein